MKKVILIGGVLLLLTTLIAPFILSDVMIKSPPPLGTPLDWIHTKLPRRPVTYDPAYQITPSSAQPEKPPEPITPESGSTMARSWDPTKSAKIIKSYRIPFDPFSAEYAVLTCQDMRWHFPWLPGVLATDPCNPKLNPLFRQVLTVMVIQMGLYRDYFPEAQTINYLLELGEPALVVAAEIQGFVQSIRNDDGTVCDPTWAKEMATYLKDKIGEPAKQPPPEAPKGNTHFETTVNRLMVEELGKEYYYSFDTSFARRLRLLGEGIVPYLAITAQQHSHALLRRNAVALLGAYDSPIAVAALREIVTGSDAVARNRALSGLIQRGDKEIIPFLIEALKGKDEYFKTYAAYALGALGAKEAIKPLLDYLKTDPNKTDILWAVVPALGSIGEPSDEVKTALRKVADKKIFVSRSMALLALAALGEDTLKELKIEEGKDPLKKLEPQVHFVAITLLGAGGAKNTPELLEVARSKRYSLQLRLAALQNAVFTTQHIPDLKAIIQDEKISPILKAYALYKLADFRDKDLVTLANQLLNQALANFGKAKQEREGGGFEGVIALRVLGALNLNKEQNLYNAINQIVSRLKSKPPRKEKKDKEDDAIMVSTAPLLETAILELGKMKSREAARMLAGFLKQPDFPCRAEAALALGQTPRDAPTIELLIKTLSDENGWTRYCAYWSLVKLTNNPNPPGEAGNCEWVFDPPAERKKAVTEWEKWWKTNPIK